MSEVEKQLLNMIAFSAWDFMMESQQKSVQILLDKLDDTSEVKQIISRYFN